MVQVQHDGHSGLFRVPPPDEGRVLQADVAAQVAFRNLHDERKAQLLCHGDVGLDALGIQEVGAGNRKVLFLSGLEKPL